MKRLFVICIACLIFFAGLVLGAIQNAAFASAPALVTPTPPAPSIVCFVNDDRYVLQLFTEATPTRISLPTVTALPVLTPTVTLAPTPSFLVRTVVNGVNVRACPGTTCAIVGGLAAGANVNLSTAPGDTVVIGAATWMRLSGATQRWINIGAAGIVR